MDIVICTDAYDLLKKTNRDFLYHYWSMSNPPQAHKFKKGNKIWFAVPVKVKNKTLHWEVMGYFICKYFYREDPEETIIFEPDSWVAIDDGSVPSWMFFDKHFQGFKYRWWKYRAKKTKK